MDQVRYGPDGATGADTHRTGTVRPNGWRRVSAETLRAEALARAGEATQVEKGRAVIALKRVGAAIGLKAADLLLIDTLAAFTQPQDWDEGRRPIVWASNAYLMEKTGFSLSALKRHARRLADLGLIAFQDSPNGKRWGRRSPDGVIIEAYGFDLSPLAARIEEFTALDAQLRAEREVCQRLKRQVTITRRRIRARIETALTDGVAGPWDQLKSAFETLLTHLPRRGTTAGALETLLCRLTDLLDKIETVFTEAVGYSQTIDNASISASKDSENATKPDPRGTENDPHIQTTTQHQSVICNATGFADGTTETDLTISEVGSKKSREDAVPSEPAPLEIPIVLSACPEFSTWARMSGREIRTWRDLHRKAEELRPMIGMPERAWRLAQDRLGPYAATAAFALVFDKHCAGEVRSPGGYLRGMVTKAGAGALHLERSLYGRLNRVAA